MCVCVCVCVCIVIHMLVSGAYHYRLQIEDKDSRSYCLAPGCLLPSIWIPRPSFAKIYLGILILLVPAVPHPCQDLSQAPPSHTPSLSLTPHWVKAARGTKRQPRLGVGFCGGGDGPGECGWGPELVSQVCCPRGNR